MEHKQDRLIKYIRSHGHRVVKHDNGSVTIYIDTTLNGELIQPSAFHVRNIEQARSVMGY